MNASSNGQEPIESQEVLNFPALMTVRVIGANRPELEQRVRAVVAEQLAPADFRDLKTKPSANGSYLAVLVTVNFPSRASADRFFSTLSSDPLVTMML